ncbi:MAG: aminomethyl-transferring glycine dehydrogenase subunit GcvPA [Erythrobacter sp.]|nr:aminomethyl-transferring glycine dehydrogenase subunit GcvPA [Erythrobacter sp.]
MRYLPLTQIDRQAMLDVIGAPSVDALFSDVPADLYLSEPIAGLPRHATEMAVEKHMRRLSKQNLAAADAAFFCGAGAYRHHVPATVDHIIQRGEFLTSYTPYQPEIAQGTLQMLFEFQTQVARLYGCAIANASMYDGSTACWEAIVMAARITRRHRVLLTDGLHPHYVAVAQTMAKFTPGQVVYDYPEAQGSAGEDAIIAQIDDATSCVVVQYPDIMGRVPDLAKIAEAAHAKGALLIAVNTEPVALGLIKSPGEQGADIVVGEGQALGVGLQFGGPYLGLFAIRDPRHVRQMPGRLCGETVDASGKRGFVLTLSTREQHIRREKATSNICTNSGLCALAFSIHMTLLGEKGLRQLAERNHAIALGAAERLSAIPGCRLLNESFFNEFTLMVPGDARQLVRNLAGKGVLAGVSLGRLFPDGGGREHGLVLAFTETNSPEDIDTLVSALKEALR